jgi:hypothetical protein
MGKNQSASGLTNIVQYDNDGNISLVSGSTTLLYISSSGEITIKGVISGSNALSASYAASASNAISGAYAVNATTASYAVASTTASYSLTGTSASYAVNATTASYAVASTSGSYAINATTASYAVASTNAANATLFNSTASSVFSTTGSNTLTGTQYVSNTNNATAFSNTTASIYTDGGLQITKDAYFSSSMFIKGNLTVFGTQSVSFISSSQLNIGTNLITVNTDTPSIRFGGLAVYDSGSTGLTGSILWDSQENHWVYTNPSGSSYSGGMFISGPRASSLGSEQGTTLNAIMKGQGGDHITSSIMFESASFVGIGTSSPAYKLDVTGTGRFTGAATFNGTVNVYDGSSRGLSISNSSGAITFSNNWGKTTFTAPSSQDIEFNDDAGVKRLFLKNGGNVGIGTNSPLVLFDVRQPYAKTDTTRRDILYASNESSPSGLRVSIVGGASQAVRSAHLQTTDWGTTNDGSIVLQPFGGNVGIGIENPSSILYISAQSDTVGGNGIRLGNSGVNRIWNTRFGTNTDLSYNLDFYDGSTWSNRFKLSYTGAATFFSTISAGAATFSGRAISNGYKSYSGEISIASGVTSTIYTMGDNGLYTVQIIVGGGSLIYSAAAIFYSHSNNGQFVKTIDLYDGANVTLDQSAGAIRITNNGFATLTWNWSIIFQPF